MAARSWIGCTDTSVRSGTGQSISSIAWTSTRSTWGSGSLLYRWRTLSPDKLPGTLPEPSANRRAPPQLVTGLSLIRVAGAGFEPAT